MKKKRALALAIAIAAFAIAAVFAASGATATTTLQPTARASAAGDITIGSVVDINTLDPQTQTFLWGDTVLPLLFDSLTKYTATSGIKVVPDLATSWTISKDLKTYTFTMRSGVTFSNGDPLTAADVVASYKRAIDPAEHFTFIAGFANVATFTAPNSSTVQITLSKPSSGLLGALTSLAVVDTTPAALANIATAPIGSGPYVVSSFQPGTQVTFTRNPKYWGPAAPTNQIQIVVAADPTSAVTSLNSGDLLALGNLGLDSVKPIQQAGDAKVILSPVTAGAMVFTMDNTSPPFNNVNARLGLAYATDRVAMLKAALGGVGTLSTTNVPINKTYLNPKLPTISFNLAKAKALFAKAGVKKGTKLQFWTVATQPFYSVEAEILQQDLAKIGITLTIKTADVATWAKRLYPVGKKFPYVISSNWYAGTAAPANLGLFAPPSCECQWKNPTYVKLLQAADAAPTHKAQLQDLYKAEAIFQTDAPIDVISITGIPIAVRNNLKGVWIDPRDIGHFENASVSG